MIHFPQQDSSDLLSGSIGNATLLVLGFGLVEKRLTPEPCKEKSDKVVCPLCSSDNKGVVSVEDPSSLSAATFSNCLEICPAS